MRSTRSLCLTCHGFFQNTDPLRSITTRTVSSTSEALIDLIGENAEEFIALANSVFLMSITILEGSSSA